MNILALDLGTHTGYCHTTSLGGGFFAGTWILGDDKEIEKWRRTRTSRRRDPRILRLHEKLQVVRPEPRIVVFEDVQFQTYTYQTQLWSSLRAAMWLAFGDNVIFEGVPVGTLKKFATGYHMANKELMAKRLYGKFPEYRNMELDDNAVDAIWLYKWAERNMGRIV